MNLVQTNIPDHANILQMLPGTVKPMKNIENTMKFPPTKRLRMDIHDLNICYPSANSFRLTANPPGKPNMLQEDLKPCKMFLVLILAYEWTYV